MLKSNLSRVIKLLLERFKGRKLSRGRSLRTDPELGSSDVLLALNHIQVCDLACSGWTRSLQVADHMRFRSRHPSMANEWVHANHG